MTEVSYLGFVHGTMAALARMRPRDRGTIVQVGSALGQRRIPLQSAYCGAKHAINGFTESVRCELLHERSQGADHRGADAGGQHPAVLLGAVPAAPPSPAGTADLPARGRRPRRASMPPTILRANSTGSATARRPPLVAQKFVAPLLDRYLARTGYESQQTEQQVNGEQPQNLWQPVDDERHRPRRPRRFRQPVPRPQPAAVVLPPPAAGSRDAAWPSERAPCSRSAAGTRGGRDDALGPDRATAWHCWRAQTRCCAWCPVRPAPTGER